MIDSASLLADLKRQLAALEKDLRAQSEDEGVPWSTQLREEFAEATRRGRTALTWSAWRDGEVAQAAVAWLVASTFIRFCEDNHLLDGHQGAGLGAEPVWLAGSGDRTARAVENQQAHYEQNPTDNSRDWLLRAFRALADLPAGRALVDPDHNPVWRAHISAQAADALLDFWRRTDDDGALRHDFTDPDLDTRFLGDLYQELSDHAKKTFALLQTPEFVEEFILDRTLTPAIDEFGLEGLKLIDPTCGSGHFLLGAFARLDEAWREHAPGLSARERVQKALDSVHGVDLNPFAVAIARFRLTVAALRAAGDATLTAAPAYRYHLAVGDSLLGEQGVQGELDLLGEEEEPFAYANEDLASYRGILGPGQYHVVVGNPPYITPKDKALNEAYRKAYPDSCGGKYALSAPFMELFFRLARRAENGSGAGYVGKITSNSFMKREFGKKVIENFLSSANPSNPVDLTAVIDTSGSYIPGHGTPTVILVGRRRRPVGDSVRAVLGVRGEPGQPTDPAKGLVWTEIVNHIDEDRYDGTYVSVARVPRESLATHPWSLSGGGAGELKEQIDSVSALVLAGVVESIGFAAITGDDDVFVRRVATGPLLWDSVPTRRFVEGDRVRDFGTSGHDIAVYPYPVETAERAVRVFWPFRSTLRAGLAFGKTREDSGKWWGEYILPHWPRLGADLLIAFAFVATHNHFVLDRGGKVFKQSAPVIKLPADASEDDHLGLLAVLNSSTACFWLKQVSYPKGGDPVGGDGARVSASGWDDRYEFTGTKLQEFPLPPALAVERGRALDSLAQQSSLLSPDEVVNNPRVPLHGHQHLAKARAEWEHARRRMIFEQEELDWDTYRRYGLIDEDLTYRGSFDTLNLGERAFEIVLARRVAEGAEETAWFERHGSTPITEVPAAWPADYRAVVERRLELIESNPHIRLLERPEYKRRWATRSWEDQEKDALREFALDRLEAPELWRDTHGAVTLSVAQLADKVREDHALREVLALLTGSTQFDLVQTLTALVKDEAVPYLAALRLKESGMTKFREWQQVWDLQRREDKGEELTIPVPPRYTSADFRSTAAWRARGKLDVPKERFIAYPGVLRAGDSSPVIGWAGWDHADQGLALARAVVDMKALGADRDDLVPLLAGLAELEPWLHQWHADVDPARGGSPAQAVTAMLDSELRALSLTRPDLEKWRPAPARRGRRPRTES